MRWKNWLLLFMMAVACRREGQVQGPVYEAAHPAPTQQAMAFAVHPLHNPAQLAQAYGPLLEHLSLKLAPVRLQLEASRDYGDFETKVQAAGPPFLLPNPWQALEAMKHGYRVIAMAGDREDFVGLILVRKDGGIRRLEDLRGKVVSYPSPTAVAACLLPQEAFYQKGIHPVRDLQSRFVGSQDSSILHVATGLSSAGATWPPPWRAFEKNHPQEAAQLQVLHTTRHLPNNAVMVRADVPQPLVDKIKAALLDLESTTEGRAILAGMETRRFHPATDQDYEPVRQFIQHFEQDIRKVKTP